MTADVLVVGGGPAGSSVAIRLARRGHAVTLVEKRPTPRHKSCGDALTPRALGELDRLGVEPVALGGHRTIGVRMLDRGRPVDVRWPDHPTLPSTGATLRRPILDEHLRRCAADAGVTVLTGHEAVAPVVERGLVRGARTVIHGAHEGVGETRLETQDVLARFVVVADGGNSRFGRVLGTTRDREWPYGVATRTYFASPRSSQPWIESTLRPQDADGRRVAGYGWVIPLGDGTVNVGVAMLSTYRDARSINALKLLATFSEQVADAWQLDPQHQLKEPTRFRVPLGGSVGPKMGPTFLVVGDAAGAANPFNGDGVDAALLTGRLAAEVLDDALTSDTSAALQRYPTMLAEELGRYYHVGRLTARFVGRPAIARSIVGAAMRSPAAMGGILRIATNELRPDGRGGAERAYALASAASRLAPNW